MSINCGNVCQLFCCVKSTNDNRKTEKNMYNNSPLPLKELNENVYQFFNKLKMLENDLKIKNQSSNKLNTWVIFLN